MRSASCFDEDVVLLGIRLGDLEDRRSRFTEKLILGARAVDTRSSFHRKTWLVVFRLALYEKYELDLISQFG